MRFLPRCALHATLLLLAAPAAPAAAQALHGTVRDAEHGRPIAGARLLLLGEEGGAVDSTRSDATGGFRMRAPAGGEYVVHFQLDGWATISSDPMRLSPGTTTELAFPVRLISSEVLRDMSEMITTEPRLQESLPELCGEPLRPWEAGLIVGRVRARATRRPVAGARVSVAPGDGGAAVRATVSSENGVYILCNVPAGTAIRIIAEPPEGGVYTTPAEIRAGNVAWQDLEVGARRN